MRVLVCGGRDYADKERVWFMLDGVRAVSPINMIIHGGATGADALAGAWAKANKIREWAFPADWDKYGRRAGPIRNRQMLDASTPHLVLAFPGATGTADLVKAAKKRDCKVVVVKQHREPVIAREEARKLGLPLPWRAQDVLGSTRIVASNGVPVDDTYLSASQRVVASLIVEVINHTMRRP